ncbi:hypothetical protein L195_g018194 [Trifolium pratense]|uniref:Uncharacterized protein n=1 Tax=Trifolium pratense TaxID=57577 RepID=A0A2K3JZF7_TRIPR|nr:hypothetical protein L195_g051419 [Trifolium pratense]PNX95012.1 hypothetical protein L195_g018194 [Trifolium pratense]
MVVFGIWALVDSGTENVFGADADGRSQFMDSIAVSYGEKIEATREG